MNTNNPNEESVRKNHNDEVIRKFKEEQRRVKQGNCRTVVTSDAIDMPEIPEYLKTAAKAAVVSFLEVCLKELRK